MQKLESSYRHQAQLVSKRKSKRSLRCVTVWRDKRLLEWNIQRGTNKDRRTWNMLFQMKKKMGVKNFATKKIKTGFTCKAHAEINVGIAFQLVALPWMQWGHKLKLAYSLWDRHQDFHTQDPCCVLDGTLIRKEWSSKGCEESHWWSHTKDHVTPIHLPAASIQPIRDYSIGNLQQTTHEIGQSGRMGEKKKKKDGWRK